MRKYVMGLLALLALVLPLALLSGCNGDDNENEVNRSAVLSGLEVVPPVTTNAFGTGTVNINNDRNRITASLTATNFTSAVTEVDIHYGRPGEVGPLLFTLFNNSSGAFPGTVTRTFTSADLATQPLGSPITNFTSAVNAIINGNTYFLVHTVNFPDGELRGQIGNQRFLASLNGNNIVPTPVTTTGTGTAALLIPPDRNSIGAYVRATNLTSAVQTIEIRFGTASQNGPLLFTVFDVNEDGAFTGSFARTLTSADFVTPAPGATITTFSQAIDAIRDGNAYLVITTVNNPTGEIRGQFLQPLTNTH